MLKFVIHAGPPKTGSTYLQMSLRALAPKLRAAGVWYPDVWWTHPGHFNHAMLLHGIMSSQDEAFQDGFRQFEASDAHTIVLSSEGFGGMRRNQLTRLRRLIGDHDCKVIYYCRRWSDWVPSQWQESVKAGRIETLPEACARIYRDPSQPPINFSMRLDWLTEIFGPESVQLISLSNLIDEKIDMANHFCDAVLGLPGIPPPDEGGRVNESRDPFMSELGRILNVLKITRGEEVAPRIAPLLIRFREHPDLRDDVEKVLASMESSVATITLDDNLPPLRGVYNKLLTKYRGILINPGKADGLFEKRVRTVTYVRQDYLLHPGIPDTIARISACLDNKLFALTHRVERTRQRDEVNPKIVQEAKLGSL